MTIYETIRNNTARVCIFIASLMVTSCTRDEAIPSDSGDLQIIDATSGIFISGAGAGGANSRGFVEPDNGTTGPQVEGISRADKMDVYVFKVGKSFTIDYPTAGEFAYTNTFQPTVKVIGNDRYAECTEIINYENVGITNLNNYTYVLSSALAYTEADQNLFKVDLSGEKNRTNVPLSLLEYGNGILKYKTPELFYGIVRGKGDIKTDEEKFTDGLYWQGKDDVNITFYGRIFRIVSQLNLHITEIPSEAIDKIELYGDNYPTAINLYGTHGAYYPVTVANATTGESPADDNIDLAQSTNYVLLDSKDITNDTKEITLSTFLLPNEQGMHLKLRVYFHDTSNTGDSDSNPATVSKDYDLRPDKSYTLSGNDASVYIVNNNDLKTPDNELYVFDNNQGKLCFYSYANVRVNMNGKYENIAGEISTVNITIEVDPRFEHGPYINGGFEGEHDIPLN